MTEFPITDTCVIFAEDPNISSIIFIFLKTERWGHYSLQKILKKLGTTIPIAFISNDFASLFCFSKYFFL